MSDNTPKKKDITLPRDLVLPTSLALSKDIPDEYKFLYAYISYRCSTRGYMWYEDETLAKHLGKGLRSIKRGIKALSDAKWIYKDNWVKKGSLYHGSFRRVIWVYKDYLDALDGGGYGVTRPLPFRTWESRFINALLDESAIPLVLYFFPTMKHMGSLNVSFDAETDHLYRYTKSDDGYKIINMTKPQADEAYKIIYDFYCEQHQKPKKQIDEEQQIETKRFDELQKFIREEYIDKTIFNAEDGSQLTINVIGLLVKLDKDGNETKLDSDRALEWWQWLYVNQDKIIELEQGSSDA